MGDIRDRSLDVMKGVLITLLVVHHYFVFGFAMGLDDIVINIVGHCQRPLITCYFMEAFFVITGMCSNFEIPAGRFLMKQIKTLLLPGLMFEFLYQLPVGIAHLNVNEVFSLVINEIMGVGWFWFLISMFSAKVIYYYMLKVVRINVVLVLLLVMMCAAGTILNDVNVIPNYYWHRQTLDMILFLGLGNIFKKQICRLDVGFIAIGIYAVGIVFGILVVGFKFPFVTSTFSTSILNWPYHVVLALSGTISVLAICRMLKSNELLEYIGKNSLLIYIVHGLILSFLLGVFKNELTIGGLRFSMLSFGIICVSTILIASLFAYLIKITPLRWLFGIKRN